jgi:hypothetical protein
MPSAKPAQAVFLNAWSPSSNNGDRDEQRADDI